MCISVSFSVAFLSLSSCLLLELSDPSFPISEETIIGVSTGPKVCDLLAECATKGWWEGRSGQSMITASGSLGQDQQK